MNRVREKQRPSLASLIREARTTYRLAIRPQLAAQGYPDMPRDGVFALATIKSSETSAGDLCRRMGASKQSVSQLLDVLVVRGYVERYVDPVDRRRMRLTLTDRGMRASTLCRKIADRLEQKLISIVGIKRVEHARAALVALIDLASESGTTIATATQE